MLQYLNKRLGAIFRHSGVPVEFVSKEFLERYNKYSKLWDIYFGNQWDYPPEDDQAQVTINYARRFIDTLNHCLFLKGFTFCYYEEESNDLNKILWKIFDVWNDRHLLGLLIGQTGMVTGDCFIKPAVSERDTLGLPTDPHLKFHVLESSWVHAIYNDQNLNYLERVEIVYPTVDKHGNIQFNDKEIYTSDEIWEESYGEEVEGSKKENPFGFIPIVHIKNEPSVGKIYGTSDLEDFVELQMEYNEKMTDISDILDYAGKPITIIKGASFHNVNRSDARIWSNIPVNAEITNLSLDTDLPAYISSLKEIKKAMHELTGVPEQAFGLNTGISNTSASALHTMLLPLTQKIESKIVQYTPGLKKLVSMALRICEQENLIEGLSSTLDKMEFKYQIKDISFESFLPKDVLTELEKIERKMKLGIETKRGALETLKVENIDAKLQELKEEKQERLQEEIAFYGQQAAIEAQVEEGDVPKESSEEGNEEIKSIYTGMEPGTGEHKNDEEGDKKE